MPTLLLTPPPALALGRPRVTCPAGCTHRFSRTACDWGYTRMVDLSTLYEQGFIEEPEGASAVTVAVEGTCVIPRTEVGLWPLVVAACLAVANVSSTQQLGWGI